MRNTQNRPPPLPSTERAKSVRIYWYPVSRAPKSLPAREGLSFIVDDDLPLHEHDIVILPYDVFVRRCNSSGLVEEVDEEERNRREQELTFLVREKGGLVCWLLDKAAPISVSALGDSSAYVEEVMRLYGSYSRAYPAFGHLAMGCRLIPSHPWASSFSSLDPKCPEFAKWVRSYSSTRHSLVTVPLPHGEADASDAERFDTLCAFGDGSPAGIAARRGRGIVAVLPYVVGSRPASDVALALADLAEALGAYKDARSGEPPDWLPQFTFAKEAPLREELSRVESERRRLLGDLTAFEADKRLLYLSGDDLTEAVASALGSRGLGIQRDEKFNEDFILLDGDRQPAAVCEVKGVVRNATGNHINQINSHRGTLGYEYTFPGLLVVNTYCRAQALDEKYQQIEPKTRLQAATFHVVVVRTIDLLLLLDMVDNGTMTAAELRDLLTTKPGWLLVGNGKPRVIAE
jgi:hypothetical protein